MKEVLYFIILISFFSCRKEKINPYDNPDLLPPIEDSISYFSDPTNFISIYNDIFLTTCANAGCHDGSFDPDFRTIESSYNTLVYHPVIKNNPNGSYQYRVKAGTPSESVLYARLLADANGTSTFDANSQVMPLTADIAYDPNQEHIWHLEKEDHIKNIKTWIENGAPDMFGNTAVLPNNKPEMLGVAMYITGTTTLSADLSFDTIDLTDGSTSDKVTFATGYTKATTVNLEAGDTLNHSLASFAISEADSIENELQIKAIVPHWDDKTFITIHWLNALTNTHKLMLHL